jgi:nitrilase
MLIDPWGEIVAERTEDGEGIVVGDIDVDHVASIRESLPALRHRTM